MGENHDGDADAGRGSMVFTEAFAAKYEEAIRDLSDDEVAFVASLSAARLQEYVYSPARIRPFKLQQWRAHAAPSLHEVLLPLLERLGGLRKEDLLHLVRQLFPAPASPSQARAPGAGQAPETREP